MSINWKYTIGAVTIAGIAGLTAYSIYSYMKQKKQDEESISLEEAEEILRKHKENLMENDIPYEDPTREIKISLKDLNNNSTYGAIDDAIDSIPKQKSFISDIPLKTNRITAKTPQEIAAMLREEEEEMIEDDLRDIYELEEEPVLLVDEGEGTLRHDPNSNEAVLQFMRMELAEWAPHEEEYKVMMKLYSARFSTQTTDDEGMKERLMDHRAEFFGNDSMWNRDVGFADVLLYYARSCEYNLNGSVRDWVDAFIENIDINSDMSDSDISYVVQVLNSHDYSDYPLEHYGIFALSDEQIENVIETAAKTYDGMPSYDIEFNEFLKGF